MKKEKWEKPELIILAKGKLGENVLHSCIICPPPGEPPGPGGGGPAPPNTGSGGQS